MKETKYHNAEEHSEKYSENLRRRKRKHDHAKKRTESCKKRKQARKLIAHIHFLTGIYFFIYTETYEFVNSKAKSVTRVMPEQRGTMNTN